MEGGVVIAAARPRPEPLDERLLAIDPRTGGIRDARIRDLPSFVSKGDVVIVNDAATLPASLRAADGRFELRLLGRGESDARYDAILFGDGDFRTPTEGRPTPPKIAEGDRIALSGGLGALVTRVDSEEPRLVEVEFDRSGADFYRALYAGGRPIQYAHVPEPLDLWTVQNRFSSRPWAFESPSAGRPLTWSTLRDLKRAGVDVASITHAAGISSTGSDALDRRFPMRERYAVGPATVVSVERAKASGGRVVAVGTTVVRALESAALEHGGALEPTEGTTNLVIGPGFRPSVVDGILSGMHRRGTSHYSLLRAFAPESLLDDALAHAEAVGYLEHEFGDSCLILGSERRAVDVVR
jgi:S-adenosylmethionine:tRNA ribosyltransferase-isomerase